MTAIVNTKYYNVRILSMVSVKETWHIALHSEFWFVI